MRGRCTETYRNVKVVLAKVAARVRRLNNHLLPAHGPARELKLIASAAPIALRLPVDPHRRPPVRQVIVHRPRRVRRAHEGAAARLAARGRVAPVAEGAVVDVAGAEGALGEGRLAGPGARGLAAVPVAGGGAGAGGLGGGGEGEGC